MKPTELVQGTLDLLILRVIALEPLHGWAIANRIRQVSKEALQVQQGSLYPALHRLEQQGWIQSEWKPSDAGRRAKYYSLTDPGKQKLADERALWERLSAGITLVLQEG
jgi:transcriptional regulator